ncbi:low-density lipoprotein receptor-related protein 5-like [Glandiceps talaboti]
MKVCVVVFLPILLSLERFYGALAQDEAITGPRLIWVDRNSFGISSRIVNIEGNGTTLWNKVDVSGTVLTTVSRLLSEQAPSSKVAIDYDYEDNLMFWTDPGYKMVKKATLVKKGSITGVFHGTSSYVEGIAADWLNNKLYWTDAAYNWVMVSDYEGTYYHCIIDTGLDKPRGIAVNPYTGHLFWTDWGSNAKVEMASLSGENRITLVSESVHGQVIGLPNGLTVDYDSNSLYWADSSNDNLYCIHLKDVNGTVASNQIIVIGTSPSFGHFFDIDMDSNYFFISDWGNNAIDIIPRNNLDETRHLRPPGMFKPYGVVMYDQARQPGQNVPCQTNNGGCDQLCVGDPGPIGYKCICSIGYTLLNDSHTCGNLSSHVPQMQLFFVDKDGICQLPANIAHVTITTDNPYKYTCFLKPYNVSVFDYDIYSEKLYFYDRNDSYIKVFSLEHGGEPVKLIQTGEVTGIAVDWLSSNLYWTDLTNKHIGVSKLDGSYKMILLEKDVVHPTAIVVNPHEGVMYWADAGPNPRIVKCDLSGRNPMNIVDQRIIHPASLTIDFDKQNLYWSDKELKVVNYISLDGNNERPFLQVTKDQNTNKDLIYFGLTGYKDFLFVTELTNHNIIIVNKEEKSHTQTLSVKEVGTIKFYGKSVQKENTSACDIDNGGCSQLCLPTPNGPECVCQDQNDKGQECDSVLRCPTSFLHGSVDGEPCTNTPGNSCEFKCDSYFKKAHDQKLKCGREGFWNQNTDKLCVLDTTLDDFLLVTDTNARQITLIDMATTEPYKAIPLPIPEVVNPVAIDYDFVDNMIYWTDANKREVYRARLDGSEKETLAGGVQVPDGLALDLINHHVYWTDAGNPGKIERANLNGTEREVVIGENLEKPRAIIVDNVHGYVYWTDWSTSNARIERVRLNGADRSIIVQTSLKWPNGLAIDFPTNKLYWIDASLEKIEFCDLDGQNRTVLVSLPDSHPFGLTVVGDYVYWTDWQRRQLSRADKKNGQNIINVGEGVFQKPNDIHAYVKKHAFLPTRLPQTSTKPDVAKQPPVVVTTASPKTITNAKLLTSTAAPSINDSMVEPIQHQSRRHFVSIMVLMAVVLLILIILVVVFLFWRQRRNRPSLSARMAFDRPVYKNLTEETDGVLAYYRDDEAADRELANTQGYPAAQTNGEPPKELGKYSRLQFDRGNEYVTFSQ